MDLSPKAQASLNKVIEKLKNGDLSQITKVTRIRLDPNCPAAKWSFSNRVIAYLQTGNLDCRGFQQWKLVNRDIKKGSQAAFIFSPKLIKNPLFEIDKTEDEYNLIGYTAIPVFSIDQTTGSDPLDSYSPLEFPSLYDLATKLEITIKYMPLPDDRLGSCNPIGTIIKLGSHAPNVFFHELAHAIHARTEGKLKSGQDQKQEIVAEFSSAVLMDLYGYSDYTGNAWDYIKHYSKDPLLAITRSMKTIESVLEYITNLELNS